METTETKKISNLDSLLTNSDDQPIRIDTGGQATIRKALLILLNNHRCSMLDTLRLFEVAVKIRVAGASAELSEADHAFVKDVLEKSWQTAPFGAYAMAQLHKAVT